MKITNKYNLPEPILRAAERGMRRPTLEAISVTTLADAPLIRWLKMHKWDELEEDCSERLWAIMGTALHVVLEGAKVENAFQEETLAFKLEAGELTKLLTGTPDLLKTDTLTLSDWKNTSVWSFLLGVKVAWVQQLNFYRYLYEKAGFMVKHMEIVAFIRDWRRGEYERYKAKGYPEIPFLRVEVPLTPLADVEREIYARLDLHMEAEKQEDELSVALCSPEERWMRETKYAVMKEGRKSAVRVMDSREEAEKIMAGVTKDRDKHSIVERLGQNVRCASYCPVRAVCQRNPERGKVQELEEGEEA